MKTVLKSILAGGLGSAAANAAPGGAMIKAGAAAMASRLALRSLPGAALVGGLLLARHLYKARKEKAAHITDADTPLLPHKPEDKRDSDAQPGLASSD